MSGVLKLLTQCIYCPNPPDGEEHWLPRSFGAFRGNTMLKGRICRACNERLGRVLDQELVRTGPTGMARQVIGIAGRAGQAAVNVFDYRASQVERPIQVESTSIGGGLSVPLQAIGCRFSEPRDPFSASFSKPFPPLT
jgi:hypothetical protein